MNGRQIERVFGGLIWRAWCGFTGPRLLGLGVLVSWDHVDGLTASVRLGPVYGGVGVE